MRKIVFALFGLLFLGSASAGDWGNNFDTAIRSARSEHKLVLLDFTGSDWCPFCKSLDDEVLDSPQFKKYAKTHYECVTVDFPHEKELPDMVQTQNQALDEKFRVGGFPTLLVLDGSGNELGRIEGYEPGIGPDAVIAQLNSFDKRRTHH